LARGGKSSTYIQLVTCDRALSMISCIAKKVHPKNNKYGQESPYIILHLIINTPDKKKII